MRGISVMLMVLVLSAMYRLAPVVPQAPAPTASPPPVTVFQGATIVDVRDGRLLRDQAVVVVGNRIQAVGQVRRVRVPSGARVIRADGTYMIPGLWDMHVHTHNFPQVFYPLMIANGVTGVREMSTISLDSVRRWRKEVLAGDRIGPRIIAAGPQLMDTTWRTQHWRFGYPWAVFVATPEEGRRAVDSLKAAGADFIKVYDGHSRAVYFAIASQARKANLPLAGHSSDVASAMELSDSGQRSIEHYLTCDIDGRPDAAGDSTVDPRRCAALAARFRRNGTWFSVAHPWVAGTPLVTAFADVMRYWPDSVLAYDSLFSFEQYQVRLTDTSETRGRGLEAWAAAHRRGREMGQYAKMQRAGIQILAGTDAAIMPGTIMSVPGFSLHGCLWTFVQSGLTPLQALQTATLNPAEYFGATDSLGTIAPGKLADFVLLDANPLQDIYNTRRVRAVVANGRFFDRGTLDRLLVETEQLARRSRSKP